MIRFYNGKTLRFDGGAHLTADEVWTDGGVIVHVGAPSKETPAFERDISFISKSKWKPNIFHNRLKLIPKLKKS